MIHIDYVGDMTFYKNFVEKFHKKLSEWEGKGINQEIGKHKNDSILMTQECKDFIDYLLGNNKLEEILNKPAHELPSVIDEIKNKYPILISEQMKSSALYKFMQYAFVKHGYDNLEKAKMIEAVGIDVCPYCNRTFIRNVSAANGKVNVKGELDHFYDKADYPYLAICKYNLVPCCHYCNGASGKHAIDANSQEKPLVNPYTLHDSNGIKIHAEISNSNILNLKKMADSITVKVEAVDKALESNIETFHLRELYQSHVDYVAELFVKLKLKRNKQYCHFVRSLLRSSRLGLSKGDIERVIHGFYVEEKDFGKRPLSKFQYDIAKDLGII